MDPDISWPNSRYGQMRNDQGDMTDTRNHRVVLVSGTLPYISVRMCVHVGNNPQASLRASVPHPAERSTVEMDVPTLAIRTQVIEVLNVGNATAAANGR